MSTFFTKSMQDVVKGIRSNKRDPKPYISAVIAECKGELREQDPFVKAEAIRKLTYLLMMGYETAWADFHIVEVMSQPRFAHKRIGYLAASQSFSRENSEAILMTTNLLKKEFGSVNPYEVGLAINCMVNIANQELARDLLSDTVNLMSHSKPYVRKKAVLAMYKLFIAYPQGLRLTFEKLEEKLTDSEASVISCAVNVICELADKNPKNYLRLAPQFFRLLTTSSNNWMLIKVVKLLGSLVPEEPRLARKLLDPLGTIIQNTAAKSLQYECIHTVTLALPYTKKPDGSDSKNAPQVVKLCGEMLKQFVEDPDQNLKYLGLVGFVQLMRSQPRTVVEHRELILGCLADLDETIRLRALELLTGMITKKNLEELIHKLLRYLMVAEGSYRDELVSKIVFMCSRDKFAYLTDFAWYTSVLVDLALVAGSRHGKLVASQLIEVCLRVVPVRPFALEAMVGLLVDARLVEGPGILGTGHEALSAAAWIVGEFASLLPRVTRAALKRATNHPECAAEKGDEAGALGEAKGEAKQGGAGPELEVLASDLLAVHRGLKFPRALPFLTIVKCLVHPRVTLLPKHVQGVYLHNALKVLVAACQPDVCGEGELATLVLVLWTQLKAWALQSRHMEVQERASVLVLVIHTLGGYRQGQEEEEGESRDEPVYSGSEEGSAAPVADLLGSFATTPSPTPAPAMGPLGWCSVARQLKSKASVLAALVREEMEPVNPKAQRRVPLPRSVDLDEPLNDKALASVKDRSRADREGPLGSKDRQVSFTKYRFASEEGTGFMEGIGSSDFAQTGDAKSAMSGGVNEIGGASGDGRTGVGTGVPWERSGFSGDPEDPEASAFYLKAAANLDDGDVDGIPMMTLRAEDLDPSPRGSKKKSKKSSKRSKGKVEYTVKTSADSDEESTQAAGRVEGRPRRKEESALGMVDLSIPLGSHEVIPELRHRTVPGSEVESNAGGRPLPYHDSASTQPASAPESALSLQVTAESEAPKKSSKKKKESKKKAKKEAKEEAPLAALAGASDGDLLLDLMGPSPAPAPVGAGPVESAWGPSQANGASLERKRGSKNKDAKKDAKKKDSKASGSHWFPLAFPDSSVAAECKVTASNSGAAATVRLDLRLKSLGVHELKGVKIGLTSLPPGLQLASGEAGALDFGDVALHARGSLVLTAKNGRFFDAASSLGLALSKEGGDSLLGLGPTDAACTLAVPTCAFLSPERAISPEDFANAAASAAASSSATLWLKSTTKKPKSEATDLAATVAAFLHCRLVERPKKTSASLFGVFPSGEYVCALMQVHNSKGCVSVEVRSSNANHAATLAIELTTFLKL